MSNKVIVRKKSGYHKGHDHLSDGPKYNHLSDSDKFKVIQYYSQGKSNHDIAKLLSVDTSTINIAISKLIKDLTLVQETNKSVSSQYACLKLDKTKTSKQITDEFLALAEENGLIFGYYFGLTNDSEYALKASGLDGLPGGTSTQTKAFVYKVRSSFLQSVPLIKDEINSVREQQMLEDNVDSQYVVREILAQLEEEKLLRADNPSSRKNSIALIKMLGDARGAFQQNIKIDRVDSKSALDTLIEMAEEELVTSTYVIDND